MYVRFFLPGYSPKGLMDFGLVFVSRSPYLHRVVIFYAVGIFFVAVISKNISHLAPHQRHQADCESRVHLYIFFVELRVRRLFSLAVLSQSLVRHKKYRLSKYLTLANK